MPRELVATAPRTPELREYEEPPLDANEVRVRSTFSAAKHGTGVRSYRADTRDYTAAFDWERRLHVEGEEREPDFPTPLGNMTVGDVVEVGEDVERFAVGDRVYGHLPIRETHTVPADDVEPAPEGMSDEAIVYADPARVGLDVVRTSDLGVGDAVAVFGLGAIGQMALRIARVAGARRVVASEPIERRREAAREHADAVLDPAETDAGEYLKDEIGGVDVSLETSGAYAGLEDAFRSTAYGGTIASCGYYHGDPADLTLSGEWHRNRIDLRSARPPSEPLPDHPRWDFDRLRETAFDLLRDGTLSADGLVDPVLPVEDAEDVFRLIDERPAETIKVGVAYGGE